MDIKNLLDNTDLITALKWIGTILITGFIAQFGRKFAEHLIDRAKKRRTERKNRKQQKKSNAVEPALETSPEEPPEIIVPEETKILPPRETPPAETTVQAESAGIIEELAKARKKEAKELAKLEKKRLKAEKKRLKNGEPE